MPRCRSAPGPTRSRRRARIGARTTARRTQTQPRVAVGMTALPPRARPALLVLSSIANESSACRFDNDKHATVCHHHRHHRELLSPRQSTRWRLLPSRDTTLDAPLIGVARAAHQHITHKQRKPILAPATACTRTSTGVVRTQVDYLYQTFGVIASFFLPLSQSHFILLQSK